MDLMAWHGALDDPGLLRVTPEDRRAFGVFYERHERAVLGFLMAATRRADVAADLTAETFATALEAAASYDARRGSARVWLFGIARNVLAASARRGRVESEARRRLGLEALVLAGHAYISTATGTMASGPPPQPACRREGFPATLPQCPPQDARLLVFGLLGPDVAAIGYHDGDRFLRQQVQAPDGGYLLVYARSGRQNGFSISARPSVGFAVLRIYYRNGTSCGATASSDASRTSSRFGDLDVGHARSPASCSAKRAIASRYRNGPQLTRATPIPASSASDGACGTGRVTAFTGPLISAMKRRSAPGSHKAIGYTQSTPAST
jgi:hypothetical protein